MCWTVFSHVSHLATGGPRFSKTLYFRKKKISIFQNYSFSTLQILGKQSWYLCCYQRHFLKILSRLAATFWFGSWLGIDWGYYIPLYFPDVNVNMINHLPFAHFPVNEISLIYQNWQSCCWSAILWVLSWVEEKLVFVFYFSFCKNSLKKPEIA